MIRLSLYAAILAMLIGFFSWIWQGRYDAGYNASKSSYEEKLKEVLENNIKISNERDERDLDTISNSLVKLNTLRQKYDELKIKAHNTDICSDDFTKLYNDSISNSNSQ